VVLDVICYDMLLFVLLAFVKNLVCFSIMILHCWPAWEKGRLEKIRKFKM
jgi:hypothetical protein